MMVTTSYSKFFNIQDLVMCFIFFFSQVSDGKKSDILINEGKVFRLISKDDKFVSINKINNEMVFINKNKMLKIYRFNTKPFYTYQRINKNKVENVFFIQNRVGKSLIGYYERDMKTFYFDKLKCNVLEGQTQFKNLLSSIEFSEGIKAIYELDKKLIDKSCDVLDEEERDKLVSQVKTVFSNKKSMLTKCLDSPRTFELFKADKVWSEVASEVFSRFIILLSQITSDVSNFKISCSSNLNSKVASFSESKNELTLAVKGDKLSLSEVSGHNVFFHELVHFGSQQFNLKSDASCLDENFALHLEAICSQNEYKVSSDQIIKGCAEQKSSISQSENSLSVSYTSQKHGDPGDFKQIVAVASASSLEGANSEQAVAITRALENGKVPVVPIESTDLQNVLGSVSLPSGEDIRTVAGDGRSHPVIDTNGSIARVFDSLSDTMFKFNSGLDSAMSQAGVFAGVATAAAGAKILSSGMSGRSVASTGVSSSGSLNAMTSFDMVASRYFPDNKAVTDLVDSPKVANMSYAEKVKYFNSFAGLNPAGKVVAKGAPTLATNPSSNQASQQAQPPNIQKASLAPGLNGRNIASLPPQNTQSAIQKNKPNQVQPTQVNDEANLQAQGFSTSISQSNTRLDNTTLQKLSSYQKLRDPDYSKLVKNVSDQKFQKLLDTRGIRFFSENGKPLWNSKVQPERCFRDQKSERALVKVKCE